MSSSLLRTSVVLALGLLWAASCSSGSNKSSLASETRAPLEILNEDTKDRVIVAEVNGVPILADCVQRQAKANGLAREAALEECISFELLAQAANQPEYLRESEVQEAGSQELVRAFVESEYAVRTPDDLPDELVAELWKEVGPRIYNRPELREIVFCRIEPPKGAGPENEEWQKASRYLADVYKQLKSRKSLTQDQLFEACYGAVDAPDDNLRPYKLAGIETMLLQTSKPYPRRYLMPQFRANVFDGPEEEGMVTPPLFTRFGWDLILLNKIMPAVSTEFATIEPELRRALLEEPVYEAQRDALFDKWYAPMEKRHQVTRNFDLLTLTQSTSALGTAAATGELPAAGGATP